MLTFYRVKINQANKILIHVFVKEHENCGMNN